MTILHGECILTKVNKLPKGVIRKKLKDNYQIIANSETSGNHHVVDIEEGVEFYEKDGKLYLKVENEATVRCLIKERHDEVKIDKGIYEIDYQKEFDYLDNTERLVRD